MDGYPLLKGKLAERGITKTDVAKALGVHLNTLINKLDGKTPFTVEEAFAIKDDFLPDIDLRSFSQRKNPINIDDKVS